MAKPTQPRDEVQIAQSESDENASKRRENAFMLAMLARDGGLVFDVFIASVLARISGVTRIAICRPCGGDGA
ncbi:MAG TPA: hypothetical protein P5307_15775, partial [Pirellulaceae bacterium]|nr:hypothetical protein [Pirellulaceae bacterium]